mmetsp:Transcript_2002/g.2980  ORF Transcript_2002/g.2980 Transcript_2002/m.2980 type:complete len:435 (-) Transcript_2002:22-1326(-)
MRKVVTSPVRVVQRNMKPGSIQSSVFNLIIICMGAGTITIPYVYYQNGLVLGTAFIFLGGALSLYTGYLIAFCAQKTGGRSFEEIAEKLYGKYGMIFTSFCNVLCNVGFLISYIVLFKDLMPYALQQLGVNLPDAWANTDVGQRNWALVYSFVCLLPVSLPRSLNALRFTSLVSFAISLFMVFTIFSLCFMDVTPNSFDDRIKTAWKGTPITLSGIFNSLPLIIFSYMYQPNIPSLYQELKKKRLFTMQKVLWVGTGIASVAYIMAGMFGYLTWDMDPNVDEIMTAQNILLAPYGDGHNVVKVCLVAILVVVLFASPFTVLPTKDSIEELTMKGKSFSKGQNAVWTLIIVVVACAIAIVVPTIGDAMTILGATTNSFIGFLIPCIFYLKIQNNEGNKTITAHKITCFIVIVFICCSSVTTLYTYIKDKKAKHDD